VATSKARQPMPTLVDPMMATLVSGLPHDQERHGFEFKWDGIRAVYFWTGDRHWIQTRNRHDVTFRYPELRALGGALGTRAAVLDGEIVALDERGRPSFERLQRRMGLNDPGEIVRQAAAVPIAYMLFDVVYLVDRLTAAAPYTDRRALLEALELEGSYWQTPGYRVDDGDVMLSASRENGLEGVIAKRLESAYEMGRRSGAWLKIKNRLRQELVIGGWIDGEGRRKGLPGSLLLGYYQDGQFVYAGKVGTGFTHATLEKLAALMRPLERDTSPYQVGSPPSGAHFIEPRLVAEFEFSEWTKSGELRAPSFKGLREDKDAREVVREVPREA
jgi:bifunctional non-homologous end joining protein LigD